MAIEKEIIFLLKFLDRINPVLQRDLLYSNNAII
jgi:hypothetical protein